MTEPITIPGYRILHQLGQGGTASVYLAVQTSFGREVALKLMSPLLKADPSFSTRFIREARIVSQMHHASIVPVFDVGEHQNHHYLSMELLPGGDLRKRIVEGRCGQSMALDVCLAITSALELAHRKGFVHRDIKPQNILFREDGTPVLTDFGIARSMDMGTSLTATGMFVGTPSYMSPEQVKGLELDGRSDLYSLGIVLYEMLTGAVPFRADSALSIALMHVSDPLPPLPAAFAAYQPFLDRLTAKEKSQRFANAGEVLKALWTMSDLPAAQESTLVKPRTSSEPTRSGAAFPRTAVRTRAAGTGTSLASKHPWLPWAGGGLAIALAVGGVTMWSMGGKPDSLRENGPTANVASSTEPQAAQETKTAEATAAAPASTPIQEPTQAPIQTPATPTAQVANRPTVEQSTQPTKPPAESAQAREKRLAAENRARELQAAAQRQREIVALLALAQTSVASGALIQPEGASAVDHYRAVLRLDAHNVEAQSGLQRIADSLVANAEVARKADDVDGALRILADARSVKPDHPRIARLQADLEERKVKLQRRAQANLEDARQNLAKAAIYLGRQPVTLRNVGEANDHYDEARSQSADAPELGTTRDRILAGYTTLAQIELQAGQPARASKILAYARKRNMLSPALEQLEAQIQQQMSKR
jgi:serine/threonine protein kinase